MKKFRLLLLILLFFEIRTNSQILNGDFELGRNNGWTEYSQGNYTLIAPAINFSSTSINPPVNSLSGNSLARIGGFAYEVNYIAQTITLPNISPLYLSFFAQTRSANTSECAGLWVGAKTSVIINSQVISSNYLCQYNDLHQWTQFFVNLTAIAGQTAQIVFAAESANSVWSYLYLDDISLTNTTAIHEVQYPDFEPVHNYPNPFSNFTDIKFSLTQNQSVLMKIYNSSGTEIETLVNEQLSAGNHEVVWNAAGYNNGIYFCKLYAGEISVTKKLILLK
jgi:hypothetical protein